MFGKDKYEPLFCDLDSRIKKLERLEMRLHSVIDDVNCRLRTSENLHKREYVKGYPVPEVLNALVDYLGLDVVEQELLKLIDKSAKEAPKCR